MKKCPRVNSKALCNRHSEIVPQVDIIQGKYSMGSADGVLSPNRANGKLRVETQYQAVHCTAMY